MIQSISQADPGPTLNGIDVLERDGFAALRGRHVGLITNHTGLDRAGRSTIDLLRAAPEVDLVALFSPEHGIRGTRDEKVESSIDEATGLPIYSLYGATRMPTPAMLHGIDTLVFDIQDIGTRFYTYISTMGLAMEAASQNGVRFVVLDRVNPIDGVDVDGPLADADRLSFTACFPLPVRHGMTVGELARLFNGEHRWNVDLQVVKVDGWSRTAWFDETGLTWVNPSPNMRSLAEAALYPAIGLLEATNVSVGRGTATPFEVVGAPWIRGSDLADALNRTHPVGVRYEPVDFTPQSSTHRNVRCGGIRIGLTDRTRFQAVPTGLEIAARLHDLYPEDFDPRPVDDLLVNRQVMDAFLHGVRGPALQHLWEPDLARFRELRARYLLY